MAKRRGVIGRNATKNMKHPHKTKKRLEIKRLMLAARASRKKR